MDYKQAHNIAVKLAKQHNLAGLSFEDKVQECMLKWVELKTNGVNNKYIFVAMKHRLLDIEHAELRSKFIPVDFTEVELKVGEQVVIALPKKMNVTRKFVRAMLKNNLHLGKTCKEFDIPYTLGASWWRRAKVKMKELCSTDVLDSGNDVIAVVET